MTHHIVYSFGQLGEGVEDGFMLWGLRSESFSLVLALPPLRDSRIALSQHQPDMPAMLVTTPSAKPFCVLVHASPHLALVGYRIEAGIGQAITVPEFDGGCGGGRLLKGSAEDLSSRGNVDIEARVR